MSERGRGVVVGLARWSGQAQRGITRVCNGRRALRFATCPNVRVCVAYRKSWRGPAPLKRNPLCRVATSTE